MVIKGSIKSDYIYILSSNFLNKQFYIYIYIYITLFPRVYEDIHVQNKTFDMEQRVHNSGE